VAAENVRASREKSGNQQLANLPTCYYKYVYVILCSQSCPTLRGINILSSTNVPFFYMGLEVWIWMGENPFIGPFEGVGPEIETFLGTNGTRCDRYHFRAQKSLISGPTPSNVMDFPPYVLVLCVSPLPIPYARSI
jgi:hypothetical protein